MTGGAVNYQADLDYDPYDISIYQWLLSFELDSD